jgi:hypothetical protein
MATADKRSTQHTQSSQSLATRGFALSRFKIVLAALLIVAVPVMSAAVQEVHLHTPGVSGVPQGVPRFCASPTVTSAASGAWSDARTWSNNRVPGANDKVAIAAGHVVTYDLASDNTIDCVEIGGTLRFKTNANTRLKVVTIMVMPEGLLEVGSAAEPIAASAKAEIVVADRPFDLAVDPTQIGHGIVALGKLAMHGAIKTPTFLRLAQEPLAGQNTLVLERAADGWKAGDRLIVPDTRQLRANQRGRTDTPQTEKVQVASVSGRNVVLTAPLAFDHKGARDAAGTLELLPHVGNLTRNLVVGSENPGGVRGHTIFIARAEVDIRYAEFDELGRTKMGILDSAEFDSAGGLRKTGTNQIGRYAVHFHHDFGPVKTPANGYQFTLVGNAVDGSSKWGITVHHSHYGLVQDNVVHNTRGAGIVTEDGSESFNIFDHNFSVRVAGSRDAAPGNGYSSVLPNPGGDGSAFWFRGPNNVIRNNVAANAAESGFGLPVTALGVVRIPRFKGADTSVASDSLPLDTTRAAVPEFSNNEAYGALLSGVSWAWSGTIAGQIVWHASRQGIVATPTDTLTIDQLKIRGDASALTGADENAVGVWVANYASKQIEITGANVQGVRIGVASPFFYSQAPQGARAGHLTVDNSYFRTNIGVNVATEYVDQNQGGVALKNAVVRGSVFEPLDAGAEGVPPTAAISMNYGMAPQDGRPRTPLLVYDFNKQPGKNFKVYYSLDAAAGAPCRETLPGIAGWVCRGD